MDAACITNETWQDYAAGRLDEPGRERVLIHAASCPVCSDILEGISLMKQPASLGQQVKRIHDKIDLRTTSPKIIRINRTWYAAAAILVMMCGIGWYLFNTGVEQPVALRQQPEPSPEQTKAIQEKQEIIHSKDQPAAVPKPVIPKQENKSPLPEPAPEIVRSKQAITDIEEDKDAALSKNLTNVTDAPVSVVAEENEQQKPAGSSSQVVGTQGVSGKSPLVKKSKEIYPSAYNANNNSSLNPLADQPALVADSISYQTAMTHFNSMHYDSCRLSLNPVVSNKTSLYYEDGLMLAAKAALAQNDRSSAIAYLKKASKLKGKRVDEAKDLLKRLK